MTIWTSNACIRKDIWHNLYGEVITFVKLKLRIAAVLRMGGLNSYDVYQFRAYVIQY